MNTHTSVNAEVGDNRADMHQFMKLISWEMFPQAVRFGELSKYQQVRYSASVLKSGKWRNRATGKLIPAQPGYGPATLTELNRVLELCGEEFAYNWAKQQPELTGFVKLWDQGRFRTFEGVCLAPQNPSVANFTRKGVPAERRAKILQRSQADKAKHLLKIGGKKKKA